MRKLIYIVFCNLILLTSFSQSEYEAEEFVNDFDLEFAVKQMQKSEYIGTAIACEAEVPESCDSAANVAFESLKGHIILPVKSFTEIQHYSVDSTEIMSSKNPQINRLIIDAKPGELVQAAEDGEITSIFKIPGNELVIMIKHGSYRTVYGTLDNLKVQVGDWVTKGMTIGEVANTANGKVVFEIWKSSNLTNESQKVEQWIELQ